jgi:hypothetical protein
VNLEPAIFDMFTLGVIIVIIRGWGNVNGQPVAEEALNWWETTFSAGCVYIEAGHQ